MVGFHGNFLVILVSKIGDSEGRILWSNIMALGASQPEIHFFLLLESEKPLEKGRSSPKHLEIAI